MNTRGVSVPDTRTIPPHTLMEGDRQCTCHPDDNPPKPCPRKFALRECREAADMLRREGGK